MSLDHLEEAIQKEFSSKIEKVKEEQKIQCDKITAKAKEQAQKITEEARTDANTHAESIKKKKLANARLESKKEVAKAKEDLFESILLLVKKEITDFTKTPKYKKYLLSLSQSVKEKLGDDMKIQCNTDDKKILKKFHAESGLETIGGFIATSPTGVSINTTFERLIEDKKPKLRKMVYTKLFR